VFWLQLGRKIELARTKQNSRQISQKTINPALVYPFASMPSQRPLKLVFSAKARSMANLDIRRIVPSASTTIFSKLPTLILAWRQIETDKVICPWPRTRKYSYLLLGILSEDVGQACQAGFELSRKNY
jgi:hypothetical protein